MRVDGGPGPLDPTSSAYGQERLFGVIAAHDRLRDFTAGLTNDDPAITAPKYQQYHYVQYNGVVGRGATASVTFPESKVNFRYVIIQQPHVRKAICLAEVKVFLRGTQSFVSF